MVLSDDILVDIQDLHFNYDGRPVLQGINMKIPRGKVVAIMGGSGCGKTTLLRCIGGQLRPTGGMVRLEKHRVCEMSHTELYGLRRKMGMLFQFGALFTDMTVFDNVAFPMREHTDLSEAMIRDLVLMKLEAVGLRGAHALMPGELSGGMARRVSLARAQRIETDIKTARQEGDDALLVVPALQALPAVALGEPRENDPGPDPGQRALLDVQAWALQRWRSGRVDAVLATADDAQASVWEEALRAALAARQVQVGAITRSRDGDARLQLALPTD